MKYNKILFVGHSLSPFTPAILDNLRLLNYQVNFFDHYNPDLWSKLLGVINIKLLQKSGRFKKIITQYINTAFYRKTLQFNPDLILIFKGKELFPETIKQVRKKGYVVINWFPDFFDDWIWIKKNAANYDYFFTPCLYVQNFYTQTKKIYQATFVGRWTKRREILFKQILHAGLLDVWGYYHWNNTVYKSIYHGQIHPSKVANIIRASKITLNTVTCEKNISILSVNYRVFETTGVGGFILTWYNTPLEDFFNIGKEVEIFHTSDEALEKTRFYLKNDRAREKIAKAGLMKTIRQHTYQKRLQQLFSTIE